MPNKEDIIYLAGFLDGEGCITTSKTNLRITISNTHKGILDWIKSEFGGNINNQHLPANPKWKESWKWVMTKRVDVLRFLTMMYPFLKIKKREAKEVIDYLNKHSLKLNRGISNDLKIVKDNLKIYKNIKTF